MKHFSKLTKRLYRKWYKWLILPFPYLFYLSIFTFFTFIQWGSCTFALINTFDTDELIAKISSIVLVGIWAYFLVYSSAVGRRRNLKYVIGFPTGILFIAFVVYLVFYSLDFIVDFVAYLFMLIIPVACIFSIFVLLFYKLTRGLFIPVYAVTENFADPVMHTEPQPTNQPE